MARMNTLQRIKTIPTFDKENFVESTRSLDDIPHIAWPLLSKTISGLDIPEPIPRENKEGEESTSGLDDSDFISSM